jgi:hypothetical protein
MDPFVEKKAEELIKGAQSHREMSERITNFVRDQIHYGLDEWDVVSVEVLRKRQGMCAGKALLAADLHRTVGIAVRFKVIKILGEEGLSDFVKRQLEGGECPDLSSGERDRILDNLLSLPDGRDHIILQVLLDGQWVDLDIARDKELDYGMHVLGIWKETKILSEEGIFDSLDGWLEKRMQRLTIVHDREVFFKVINGFMEKIRSAGRLALKSGGWK